MPSEPDDPEVLAFSAVLAGLGEGEPQSWTAALDRLAQAAAAGSASAQAQLRLLAPEPDHQDWRALAAAVDLQPWLQRSPVGWVCRDPRIMEAKGFLPAEVCAWLIERARGRLSRALLYGNEQGGARQGDDRSNSAAGFLLRDLDVVTLLVRAKIAATVGVPVSALEPIQVLHYAPGQEFQPHYDFLEPDLAAHAEEIARSGQRMATFLTYLNAGFDGGETAFPAAQLRYKGQAGDGVLFANLDPAGRPDRRTLHAGLPPTSGEKWILSQWIRQPPSG